MSSVSIDRSILDVFGDPSWGTHLCQFYQTREEMLELVAPYLQAGLEANEFCFYIAAEPLPATKAEAAFRRLIPDFDLYLHSGQIEIASHDDWYCFDGKFDSNRVMDAWLAKLDEALAKGYRGMRINANMSWVDKRIWREFLDYEQASDAAIANYPMNVMSSYWLGKLSMSEVIDINARNGAALICRNGQWDCIEPVARRRAEDIQRRSEADLRESENKFRTLLDNIPMGVFYKDVDSVYVAVNEQYARSMDRREDDFPGRTDYDFVPRELAEKYCRDDQRVMQSDQTEEFDETCLIHGEERIVHTVKSPVFDSGGKLLGVLGLYRDVTDRVRAERELAFKSALLEAQLETSPSGILLVDENDRAMPLNARFVEMFRVPAAVLASGAERDMFEYTAGLMRDREAFLKRVAYLYAHPDEQVCDQIELADGRYIERHSSPLQGRDGESFGRIWYFRDVTDHIIAERSLQTALRAAETASRAKSEFLANVSHEIRTPMTAVLGFADMLMIPDLSSDDRRQCLEAIRRNGQALMDLIGDILDISKIEAEKMPIESVDCSLFQIVDESLATIRPRAAEKKLTLAADYAFPLPERIRTDPIRLRQILLNLLGNAVKFTERGEIRVAARLERGPNAAPRLKLAVSDTGIGIPADTLERLFQPFTQADSSTTRHYGGTGLGLAISKRLANLLGGDIAAASELGKGSVFTLAIDPGPLEDVAMLSRRSEDSAAENAAPPRPNSPPSPGRVLLAEDAPDVQLLIRRVLERMRVEVDLASNGLEACSMAVASLAEGRPYDLILMDVQMPELDGYGAVRWLRGRQWRGAIVALTAHAQPGDSDESRAAGCDDHVVKPISAEKLQELARRHLRRGSDSSCEEELPPSKSTGLRDGGFLDAALVDELTMAFVVQLPRRAESAEEAFSRGNFARLRELTHQLAGTAAVYGFSAIADAARDVYLHSSDETTDLTRLKSAVDELSAMCQSVRIGPVPERLATACKPAPADDHSGSGQPQERPTTGIV